jgi:hypothetical protein
LQKKQKELLDAKRKLSRVTETAKGCFASWFLKLFGYAGSKQSNFSNTINKYFNLLDEDAKKCFVYLKMQSDESVLADEKMYDEAFVKNRKIIDLQESYEVISEEEEEEEEYDGEADEYEEEEEMYEVKKIDVGTQCNSEMFFEDTNVEESIGNKALENMALGENYKKELKAADLTKVIRDLYSP